MSTRDIDNIVFLSYPLDIRAGGPCGYVANLKKALDNHGYYDNIAFISQDSLPNVKVCSNLALRKKVAKILTFWIPIKKYRRMLREICISLMNRKENVDYLNIDAESYKGYADVLDRFNFKSITCHCTRDAIFIKNYLASRQKQAKLLLMSHSPELPSSEIYHIEKLNGNPSADSIRKMWQRIEQRAFAIADVLLFPTKEAMEPYICEAEYFKELINSKDVQFITTGCERIDCDQGSRDIRGSNNIGTKYIVSFIGRHTRIKGYDKLKEIAKTILNMRDDVTFVIGGVQSEEIKPLSHSRWIELGRVNPADLLSVSDLFVLPNRQTYFDLVLLEVLSAGVPVVASNTGGNKSVYEATHAIELYDTNEECIEKINYYLDSDNDSKIKKRVLALAAYTNNYTLEHFAENYMALVAKVIG